MVLKLCKVTQINYQLNINNNGYLSRLNYLILF